VVSSGAKRRVVGFLEERGEVVASLVADDGDID
jgi:hypothetical protein